MQSSYLALGRFMSIQDDRDYQQFHANLLSSHFKSAFTEEQLLAQLAELLKSKNIHAVRAVEEFKNERYPSSSMSSSVWDSLKAHGWKDVANPSQTGPANTDNYGLWRKDEGKR